MGPATLARCQVIDGPGFTPAVAAAVAVALEDGLARDLVAVAVAALARRATAQIAAPLLGSPVLLAAAAGLDETAANAPAYSDAGAFRPDLAR